MTTTTDHDATTANDPADHAAPWRQRYRIVDGRCDLEA